MTGDPLAHAETFASTGLRAVAPFRDESGVFVDSPTSLDVTKSPAEHPLYARLTARIEPAGSLSLDGSSWIWYPDDDPPWDLNEPSATGDRYFRKTFDLEEEPAGATFVFTADNLGTLSINGTEVGTSADSFDGEPSDSWQHAPTLDVTDQLEAGENVLAIEVERFGHYASLVGRIVLAFDDGTTRTIDTDDSWVASQDPSDGWQSTGFDDSDWPAAQVTGPYGMDPYGQNVTIPAQPDAAVRMAFEAGDEMITTEATTAGGLGIRSTGWAPVPAEFDGGTVTMQAASARVTVATLELAVRNEF